MRVVLDDSGLGPEYFELAAKHCADIINMEGTRSHPLGWSPLHQWTGVPPDRSKMKPFAKKFLQ